MDAESQQVEELKAEIERLKEAMEAVDDHGRALSFMETLKAKNAEIERLKQLITELYNALEEEFGTLDHRPALKDKSPWTIIQRAKEATR